MKVLSFLFVLFFVSFSSVPCSSDKPSGLSGSSFSSGALSSSSSSSSGNGKGESYGSPVAPPILHDQSESYSSPIGNSPVAVNPYGASSSSSSLGGGGKPGEVETQGYYYYYYPVGSSSSGSGGSPAHYHPRPGPTSYNAPSGGGDEGFGSGALGAILAGKGILILIFVGGIILLALATNALRLTGGRSLTDLTSYAVDNLDDLTALVTQAISMYQDMKS